IEYDPSKPTALVAGAVYAVVTFLLFIRLFRRKNCWGLCLPLGTLAFSIGFFLRFASTENPTVFGLFIATQILIVVAPAAFLAFNYIVYGRLIRTFATSRDRYSLIRPEKVARIFIISDVVTFMVQGGGGGLQAQEDSANAGRVILLAGIIVQALSYVVFWFLLIHSHRVFCNDGKFDKYNFPWSLMTALHISSVFIIIRATYRVVELAQGNDGYLLTHEVTFYTLDTIPLFFATAIYTYFWPGALIEDVSSQEQPPMQMGPAAA
ncbi:RTA1 like protein, partial [Fomitiporia mediterranea MF3/22]|uniref:RTA1 like protein n=1 Tax=Fomitiporia mediterranea (strain MF3/22) TaxID=694068 RepID=UPI0004408ABA